MKMDDALIQRLRLDIARIREAQDRTGPIAYKPVRWEGTDVNPNGWRLYEDLAKDIETLLESLNAK